VRTVVQHQVETKWVQVEGIDVGLVTDEGGAEAIEDSGPGSVGDKPIAGIEDGKLGL
jgi:hypothetical protein